MKHKISILQTAAAGTVFALGMGFAGTTAFAADGTSTLDKVLERGTLNCAASNEPYPGFAETDSKGRWEGIDIELCRAIASAVLGDSEATHFEPISWSQRWPSLKSGELDVIIKASGWNITRDTDGLAFARPYFLGTTKVLFHKELGIDEMKDADGAVICVPSGTSIEGQLVTHADNLGIEIEAKSFNDLSAMRETLYKGGCDGFAQWGPVTDIARTLAPDPEAFIFLKDRLALEAEAPVVLEGDDAWLDVVNWSISALLFAEQEGITSDNVDEMRDNPPTTQVAKFLGVDGSFGEKLGLENDWAYTIIKQLGNYAEIWDRSMGKDSPYHVMRDVNALWNEGGVLYPLSFE